LDPRFTASNPTEGHGCLREWKQTALQQAGSSLYRETVEIPLQLKSELALSEPRYGGELLYSVLNRPVVKTEQRMRGYLMWYSIA
jgi:hypothetical protein